MNAPRQKVPTRNLWWKLRYTPMRDWIRGRLTGSMYDRAVQRRQARWERRHYVEITTRELPAPVGELIKQVVRKTRLWRREKIAVARELAAHFHDGLEAGVSESDLLQKFGHPKTAAKLIRRGMKRKRPWWWHTQHRMRQAIVVLTLVYISAVFWLMWDVPRPRVDYLAKINEKAMRGNSQDHAWQIYQAVWKPWMAGKIKEFQVLDNTTVWCKDQGSSSVPRERSVRPGEPGWEKVETFLKSIETDIQLLHQAANRPHMGLNLGHAWDYKLEDRKALYVPNRWAEVRKPKLSNNPENDIFQESLVFVRFPNIGNIKLSSLIIARDMRQASAVDDGDRVIADFQALLGMARQMGEYNETISQLVALSILRSGIMELNDILHSRPQCLNDSQLIALAHMLDNTMAYGYINVDGERICYADMIQRIYSDDGNGDGHITVYGLRLGMVSMQIEKHSLDANYSIRQESLLYSSLPLAAVAVPSRKDAIQQAEIMFAMAEQLLKKPWWQTHEIRRATQEQYEKWRPSSLTSMANVPYFSIPSLIPAVHSYIARMAECRASQVAIALELFHRAYGGYPNTIQELVPAHLREIPLDYSSGQPIVYRLVNGKPLLYGLGANGKDDGGARRRTSSYLDAENDSEATDEVWYPEDIPAYSPEEEAKQREWQKRNAEINILGGQGGDYGYTP